MGRGFAVGSQLPPVKKILDKLKSLCYNRDNKREEPRAMKDKVIMIISICAFAISWGVIILAAILEVI